MQILTNPKHDFTVRL